MRLIPLVVEDLVYPMHRRVAGVCEPLPCLWEPAVLLLSLCDPEVREDVGLEARSHFDAVLLHQRPEGEQHALELGG